LNRPTIVCLCGSTRFFDAFMKANYDETLKGNIVLSVGFFMHDHAQRHGGEVGITDEQKKKLDELHLRKIDLSDEVLCINVNDYVGNSTKRELWYARQQGKRLRMLELPSKIDWNTIGGWFTNWEDWVRAAAKASSTIPSDMASQR